MLAVLQTPQYMQCISFLKSKTPRCQSTPSTNMLDMGLWTGAHQKASWISLLWAPTRTFLGPDGKDKHHGQQLLSVWHWWQSREWGTPARQRYPWLGVAPYPEGSHSSSPNAQEPQVRHGLALEISSLMLSSESYSWKQKPLEWPWQGVISKAAGPFKWILVPI